MVDVRLSPGSPPRLTFRSQDRDWRQASQDITQTCAFILALTKQLKSHQKLIAHTNIPKLNCNTDSVDQLLRSSSPAIFLTETYLFPNHLIP